MLKKLLIICAAIIALAAIPAAVHADQYMGWDSSFRVIQDTITLSSSTITAIPFESGYREVSIGDPATNQTVFYRVDLSSAAIPTVGWWFNSGAGFTVESNNIIYLQLAPAVASINVRRVRVRR